MFRSLGAFSFIFTLIGCSTPITVFESLYMKPLFWVPKLPISSIATSLSDMNSTYWLSIPLVVALTVIVTSLAAPHWLRSPIAKSIVSPGWIIPSPLFDFDISSESKAYISSTVILGLGLLVNEAVSDNFL